MVRDEPGNFWYIKVDTIKGYLCKVNKHYANNNKPHPFETQVKSRAVRLWEDHAKYKKECARREPLADEVNVRMSKLAVVENDPYVFFFSGGTLLILDYRVAFVGRRDTQQDSISSPP